MPSRQRRFFFYGSNIFVRSFAKLTRIIPPMKTTLAIASITFIINGWHTRAHRDLFDLG